MNKGYGWKDKPIDCLIKEKSKLEIDVKSEQWKDKGRHIQELKDLIAEYTDAIKELKYYAKMMEGDIDGGNLFITEKGGI